MRQLLVEVRPLFNELPKSKTAKIGGLRVDMSTFFLPLTSSLNVLFLPSLLLSFAPYPSVRTLIDQVNSIPGSTAAAMELCKESIEWCKREQRSFLKQRIEARLADLLLKLQKYQEALTLIDRLIRDVKKIDDKRLLVEIHLVESCVHYALQNLPKAKGALTSARSAANSIYCPPRLQAEIDLQAGTLCAEEKDYKTRYACVCMCMYIAGCLPF